MYHFVHMLHSPAVQLGRSKGHILPSQVQTALLRPSTQFTVSFTQPPVTACTIFTHFSPPEMTTPPHPHIVAHTGMSLVTELPISLVPRPHPVSHFSKQVMRCWAGPGNEAIPKLCTIVSYCALHKKSLCAWYTHAYGASRLGCELRGCVSFPPRRTLEHNLRCTWRRGVS